MKSPSDASTFIVGTADGRVLSFTEEYEHVGGETHTNLVSGLGVSPSGTIHSVGFDDRLRELAGKSYTCVLFTLAREDLVLTCTFQSCSIFNRRAAQGRRSGRRLDSIHR